MSKERKVIQISACAVGENGILTPVLYVLTEEGSVWCKQDKGEWKEVSGLPGWPPMPPMPKHNP